MVSLLGSVLFWAIAELNGDDRQVLEGLLDAHVSNREQFAYGQAEGTLLMSGTVDSLESGQGGRITGGIQATLFWAFHGKTCRIDVIYDPDLQRASVKDLGKGRQTRSYSTRRYLTDGKDTMLLSASFDSEQAHIKSGTELFAGFGMVLPLELGYPARWRSPGNFDVELDSALKNKEDTSPTYEGEQELEGRQVAVVSIQKAGMTLSRYWVDVERGAIPLRCDAYRPDGSVFIRVVFGDLREATKGFWLPLNLRWLNTNTDAPKNVMVRDVTLSHFETGRRPADGSLRIPLRKGTSVVDEVAKGVYFVANDSSFGFGNLAQKIQKAGSFPLTEQSNSAAQEMLAIPKPSTKVWPKVLLVIGLGVMVGGIIFLLCVGRIGNRK